MNQTTLLIPKILSLTFDIETDFPSIHSFLKLVATLSPGSVDCERSFSLMNLIKTDIRNSLTVTSLANLMHCAANGPDLSSFDVGSSC
jgi:hypothetical protein